jgi:1-acyl-sn-glycerol-3-phosphate acyltransferase
MGTAKESRDETLAWRALSARTRDRLRRMPIADGGHGYDPLGLNRNGLARALACLQPLYHRYFRARSHHPEHIPTQGAAIFVANHAGTLPIDAAMLLIDVFEHSEPPRMPRAVADAFVPRLPFVWSMLSRLGVTQGSRNNVEYLLAHGESLLIFPEGMGAIGKPKAERYQLGAWRVGHAELALRHRVPVVPVAILGSEEQWPRIGKLSGPWPWGIPFVPLFATPLPLPVRYHIHYGAPLQLAQDAPPDAWRSAEAVQRAADRTRAALQTLLARALAEREGVFR